MRRSAFTLIEILVSIAVLTLLIGIMIPVISSIMQNRNDVIDLSNLRLCMTDFSIYSGDHKNRFVNAGPPNRVISPLYYGDGASNEQVINSYGGQVTTWPNVLFFWSREGQRHWHSSYEDLPDASTVSPAWDNYLGGGWSGVQYTNVSNYWYSMTMITKSDAWTYGGVRGDRNELALRYFDFVYQSQVTHPSSKAILVQTDRPKSPHDRMYAFADGSTSMRNLADAKPTAVPFESNGNTPGMPCLSTLNGYEGIDF